MGKLLRQAGVIPYRIVNGQLEVLLVTSRDTGRWVIPKGYIDKGLTAQQAAAQEAREEAGVSGEITSTIPLGFIPYLKILGDGEARAANIEVHTLLVQREEKKWLEHKERKRKWLSPEDAASRVREPALAALLLRMREIFLAVEIGPSRDLSTVIVTVASQS
jgi:8-oxo-dGTP pyrophosphatase MutT (NUDIX family)